MENCYEDCLTSIMQLPDDCLYFIFHWLDSASDRESFGLTCHRWLQIQNSSRRRLQFQCSFTKLDIPSLSQSSMKIDAFYLHRLLNRFQKLHYLSLSGCIEMPDFGLRQLLNYGSQLQTLHLHCCFGITDHGISLVASGCPSLTTISLYRCNVTDIGLKTLSESCLALKDVDLSYCSLISDQGIRALAKNCRHLRAVCMTNCRSVTGVGFMGCSQSLTFLEANGCKLEPGGIMAIVSGGGLEYLNLSCLWWCIGRDGLTAIGAGFATKLKVLDFRSCRTIGDNSIIAIAKGCPLLQEWNLALCHEITRAGWEAIGVNCHHLEKLHVNRCRNLCDEGLQALRYGCKKLSVLYMSISKSCNISSTALEIFRCSRGDVKILEEEVMSIAPDSAFHVY
ncbi:F-box/LRR-repeat protein 12 [Coffea eugenioides]|uniref:F-box/LRR-repeat protein 12 n=1 Tax=Coffea eugenioides TaxID=49369 RepID=UPI000F614A9A|nr:F-box/LRR-repeat protein 12 [Coffea eugenioides]XP_027162986.1 F-box/LRR-repeat protein 12 [Coffea eugenioides]